MINPESNAPHIGAFYVNAPIQNKCFDPSVNYGGVIPILVSRHLNIASRAPRIDLWNNVLAAEEHGYTKMDYTARQNALLAKKYKSGPLSILEKPSEILTDTSKKFTEWGVALTGRLVDLGVLKIENIDVLACDTCDISISTADAPNDNCCRSCGSNGTHVEQRKSMISTFSENVKSTTEDICGHPTGLPEGACFLVNKRRLLGIPLDDFGLPGDVVDPKVGLGLLSIFAASNMDMPGVDVVMGRSSSSSNIPQLTSYLGDLYHELPKIKTTPIARVPTGYLAHLVKQEEVSIGDVFFFVTETAPPHLVSMKKNNMSPETAERIMFGRKTSV